MWLPPCRLLSFNVVAPALSARRLRCVYPPHFDNDSSCSGSPCPALCSSHLSILCPNTFTLPHVTCSLCILHVAQSHFGNDSSCSGTRVDNPSTWACCIRASVPAARNYLGLLIPSTWARFVRVHGPVTAEKLGLLQSTTGAAATDHVGSPRSDTGVTTAAFRVVGFMFSCAPLGMS